MASPARVLAVAILGAVLAGGCFAEGDTANGGLVGTEWRVASIGGAATIAGARPTLAFGKDGSVRGTTGCNTYSGPFLTDREHLHIGELAATAMACDPARNAQEAAFDAALSGATTWRQADDGSLHMTGAAELVAIPAAATGPSAGAPVASPALTDLGGTTWSLMELAGSADLARIVPDIGFGEDATASGFAGCNTFTGTYTIDGSMLHLGPLVATKIACPRPASAVEAEVLAALAGVRTWAIDAEGRLVLDGATRLTFRPG